ncbi:MAG TPA: hypothetical protein VM143_12255, partial [Acidimicrobiales bacterium]|nr:hypothetical protein [Acidimicrobiales bacterium]
DNQSSTHRLDTRGPDPASEAINTTPGTASYGNASQPPVPEANRCIEDKAPVVDEFDVRNGIEGQPVIVEVHRPQLVLR